MALETITLEQMLQTYQHLTAEHQAGRMTAEQYAAELNGLQGIDETGHWWGVQPGGKFWRHDGQRWAPAAPPRLGARPRSGEPAAIRPQPDARAIGQGIRVHPKIQAAANKSSALLKASPILAVLPSVVCGGLWFLYTFLGLFKSEGMLGVDWFTPLIIGVFPVVLWIFKKQIDRLLLPLKPVVTSLAKPLRLGIVLGVPVLLGCVCSTAIPSGYLSLNVSSVISVVAAAILMRY